MSKDKPTYPDFIKKIHHWTTISPEGRIKAYAVYECPDDKILEGRKQLGKDLLYILQ